MLTPIAEAIGECEAFRAIAGQAIYSAGSGLVLTAPELAERLLSDAEYHSLAAVDSFLQVLTTRRTTGYFMAALWGVQVDAYTELPNGGVLRPYDELRRSAVVGQINARARAFNGRTPWLSELWFGAPKTAYVLELKDFPYITVEEETPFGRIGTAQMASRDCWWQIAAFVGKPLAIAFWFEYANADLEYSRAPNTYSWLLPEVHPYINDSTPVSGEKIRADLARLASLPKGDAERLQRSMERFTLSQCRNRLTDQILDLALAFEIAVSGEGEGGPPQQKVSLRATQMIGGPVGVRVANRAAIGDLYKLRNKTSHGGGLSDKEQAKAEAVVRDASALFRPLLDSFLAYGRTPDWNMIELEPRER